MLNFLNNLNAWDLGILLITLWQLEGLVKQSKTIWKEKRAQSVSGVFISYFFLGLLNMVLYSFVGDTEVNITLFINGSLQWIVVTAILIGWFRFELKNQKQMTKRLFPYGFILAFIAVVGLIILLPQSAKPVFTVLLTIFGIPTLFGQGVEIFKKGRGEVEMRMLLPQFVANIYLTAFAFITGEPAFQWISPVYGALFLFNIIAWLYDEKRSKQQKRKLDTPKPVRENVNLVFTSNQNLIQPKIKHKINPTEGCTR